MLGRIGGNAGSFPASAGGETCAAGCRSGGLSSSSYLCPPLSLPTLCSVVFPDYKERVVRHEAAHFLTGYLLGVPVANYSLTLGKVGLL